jgi:hypothetical protein
MREVVVLISRGGVYFAGTKQENFNLREAHYACLTLDLGESPDRVGEGLILLAG